MAHITLIKPPTILPYDTVKCHFGVPPLSIAYLAGTLKQKNHQIHAIDSVGENINQFTRFKNSKLLANGLTIDEITNRIPKSSDFIGITCMFSNEWIHTKELINKIIELHPDKPVILGGEHVTAEYEYILNNIPKITACVLGEGEQTIIELIESLLSKSNLAEIDGIAYIEKDGNIIKTKRRERIDNIDSISLPSWSELPIENYLNAGLGHGTLGRRSIPMLLSRGCPYECTFCSNKKMWGRKWSMRTPSLIIDEIKQNIKKYKINHVDFYDATAIIDKNKIIQFCKLLVENNLNISWALPSGTRSEILDMETLSHLKAAGLERIQYAPESGPGKMLRLIKKNINLEKMIKSIRECKQAGMITRASLIFGIPEQSKMDALKSILFAVKMAWYGLHDLVCFPFIPYCGSELYQELKNNGTITEENIESYWSYNTYNNITNIKSYSSQIKHWQMPFLTIGLMIFFYLISFIFRPHRLFGTIIRLYKKSPRTAFDSILYGIYFDFVRKSKIKQTHSPTSNV